MTVAAPSLSVVRTPAKPGPGLMPEALLRAHDHSHGRRGEGLVGGDPPATTRSSPWSTAR